MESQKKQLIHESVRLKICKSESNAKNIEISESQAGTHSAEDMAWVIGKKLVLRWMIANDFFDL